MYCSFCLLIIPPFHSASLSLLLLLAPYLEFQRQSLSQLCFPCPHTTPCSAFPSFFFSAPGSSLAISTFNKGVSVNISHFYLISGNSQIAFFPSKSAEKTVSLIPSLVIPQQLPEVLEQGHDIFFLLDTLRCTCYLQFCFPLLLSPEEQLVETSAIFTVNSGTRHPELKSRLSDQFVFLTLFKNGYLLLCYFSCSVFTVFCCCYYYFF